MKSLFRAAVLGGFTVTGFASVAHADFSSARAQCLAKAGTDEATFSARRATITQGKLYRSCMSRKGFNVEVLRSNGSRI